MTRSFISNLGRRFARLRRFDRFFTAMVVLCLIAIWIIFASLAYQSYLSQWSLASLSANNLAILLEHDIARNVEVIDGSLHAMLEELADPQISSLPKEARRRILSNQAANTEEIGSETVIDAEGRVLLTTLSPRDSGTDLSFRPYFQIHRDGAYGNKLFISEPYRSILDGGAWKIAFSRRVRNLDGSFGGVVTMSIRLQYFQSLFNRVQLPPDSVITLVDGSGRVIARTSSDSSIVGQRVSFIDAFRQSGQKSREYVYPSRFDGVQRLYVYHQIGDLPLIQIIGVSEKRIYEGWWPGAAVLATAFLVLSGLIIILALALRRELRRRAIAEQALTVIAGTDALTGLANRRRFDEGLALEWRRGMRSQSLLSLVMIDCDFFKSFNDAYGHVEGDIALARIAKAIADSISRPGDLAARIGGEEFAVLLPDTNLDGAMTVARRILNAVIQMHLRHAGNATGVMTVSAGVTCCTPGTRDLAASFVREADNALYDAKAKGRNNVTAAIPSMV